MKPVAAILAAGLSRRMGTAKQTLAWGDTTLIAHVIEVVRQSGLELFVVTRPDLAGAAVETVMNPHPQNGLGESVRLALAHMRRRHADAPLALLLGDQPFLTAEDILAVVEAFASRPDGIRAVRPYYDGRPGHPVVIAPELFAELEGIEGDRGVGPVLADRSDVLAVDLDVHGRVNPATDVDTPEDYRNARRLGQAARLAPGKAPEYAQGKEFLERESQVAYKTSVGVKYHTLGNGETAVLLHSSLGLGRFLFHRTIPLLARRYTVVSWDPRGVGDNRQFEPSLAGWVADAEEILATVNRPAHLVGVSMGSAVMARVAVTEDPLIGTLVLASTATAFGDGDPARIAARRSELEQLGMKAYAERYAETTLGPFTIGEIRDNLVAELSDQSPDAYCKASEIVFAMDNRTVFGALATPTLVVVGVLDQRTPPAEAERVARIVPNSWLATVLRAGHLIPLDRPRRMVDICIGFWEQHPFG